MQSNDDDPVIDEVRKVRRQISARFDHDPARLIAHYLELQKQYQDRLIDSPSTKEEEEQSAA